MKTKLLLICGLLFVATFVATAQPSAASTSKVRVAVVDVVDNSVQSIQSGYKQMVFDAIDQYLSMSPYFEPVSRVAVKSALKELNFQHSGNVDDGQVQQLGKMLGCEYIIHITVSTIENYMVVAARLVNVETLEMPLMSRDKLLMNATTFDPNNLVRSLFSAIEQKTGHKVRLPEYSVKPAPKPVKIKRTRTRRTIDFSLDPPYSSYQMRFLSNFNSTGILGFGFHFNRSYFQFGIEGSFAGFDAKKPISIPGEETTARNVYNGDGCQYASCLGKQYAKIIEKDCWPKAQVAVSPGVNLQYFSIECGLGILIADHDMHYFTKCLACSRILPDEGDETALKAQFFVRPAIVGHVPFNDGIGLNVGVGYNIYPGYKPCNSFMFCVGIIVGL